MRASAISKQSAARAAPWRHSGASRRRRQAPGVAASTEAPTRSYDSGVARRTLGSSRAWIRGCRRDIGEEATDDDEYAPDDDAADHERIVASGKGLHDR